MRIIIFDLDGTLVDSSKAHAKAWVRAFSELGLGVGEEEVLKHFGKSALDLARSVAPTLDKRLVEEAAKLHGFFFDNELFAEVSAFPEVECSLKALKQRGFQMLVASSNPSQRIRAVLRACGIEPYFEECVGIESVCWGKPHPDIFLKAAEIASADPSQCVMVGDSVYDMLAGGLCVGITRKWSPPDALIRAGASAVVKSLHGLVSLLTAVG